MNLAQPTAEIFIPDGSPLEVALSRTTHLAVGAHQDDIEIMAYDGILACFQKPDKWFSAVTVTNGSGSPRTDLYANYTDEDMMKVRRKEQKKAAVVGEYSVQFLLDYPSGAIKDKSNRNPVEDLKQILLATKPQIIYTHNLADKHDTHVGVAIRLIQALREIRDEFKPQKVYGCEVWRDLDWMVDEDKVPFDVSAHENLQSALLGIFDSQICGGKRYDLATMGRRKAHATYFASHGVDTATSLIFAMDLTPLIDAPAEDPAEYMKEFIQKFASEVEQRIKKFL
ncbi:MAG: PIG-L family deacetylase [Candidatus Hydrogenedentes bacterium]|nr:PIG-L family deacetylase [Candidatus Hydrogenedentota bacterium]